MLPSLYSWNWSLLVLLTVWSYGADAQCPAVQSPCICTPSVFEPISIACDGAASLGAVLAAIGVAQNVKIDVLSITNTPIGQLGPLSFRGFTITRLVLNRCQLSSIDTRAFEGPMIEALVELDLKDNQFNQIPQTGVTAIRNLKKFSLSKNQLSQLPPRAFNAYESRVNLEKLDFSNNRISDIGINVLAGLTSLKEISFEKNNFAYIPTAALSEQRQILQNLNLGINQINDVPINALDFPNLRSLSLEYNGIPYIQPESFRGCPNLQFLYLTGNKFSRIDPEMFRFIPQLQTLGIGGNNIQTIPANAFQYIPNLLRLEMSEAAVNNIETGAFQRTPNIQAIVMNKNQFTRIRQDWFQGLTKLSSLDLKGNKLNQVDDGAWANLPTLTHLDISTNELEFLQSRTFDNTLLQTGQRRSLFIYENPWTCDARLDWFRSWLRQNMDMTIDTSNSRAVCLKPNWLNNWPIRQPDPPRTSTDFPIPTNQPVVRGASASDLWWIILAIILAILLTSICLLAFVRWFISRKRRVTKEQEEEERILRTSTVTGYNYNQSVVGTPYPPSSNVGLALPPATSYDLETAQPNYYSRY